MMSGEIKKVLWKSPWGYRESIWVCVAIVVAGYAMQLSRGCFDFNLLRWPVNGVLGLILLTSVLILGGVFQRSKFVTWFSGVSFSVSLLGVILLLTIIMGLTPQVAGKDVTPHHWVSILGLNRMTASWPFVLLYATLLLSLGLLVVRTMMPFRWHKYAFYLNHLGLWLALLTTGLGAADLKRYVMYVKEKDDNPEWRVYNEKDEVLELPIAIYLNEFTLEQYDPKLTIIDIHSGESQPLQSPDFLQMDSILPKGHLMGWNVEVLSYLPDAIRTKDEAYEAIPMPGSAPAANVRMVNKQTGDVKTGWVSCGSFAQMYRKIDIDSTYSLVMTAPEPKSFASHVIVYSHDSENADTAIIKVNQPHQMDGWGIYQYSYDEPMGKASMFSSFELVYDPWKKYVYLSFLFMAVGSVSLFWQISKRKGKN
jgi:hypothetical protein